MNNKWLVFGASGYVGRNMVPYLLERGHAVRAAARNISVLEAHSWQGAELICADALKPETLDQALSGIDIAFYFVHSMAGGQGFPERDRKAAHHFSQAAAKAGIKRIIYLGGLAPDQAETEHLASRVETGEILRSGSVPVVELRAGIIIGAGSAAFEVMRDLVAHLPIMVTPRWIHVSSPPIALPDLLADLTKLALLDDAEGLVFETGGPERLTYETMMRRLASALGKRNPIIIPVPLLTPKLSSYWLDLVTGVPAPIARALIGGLKHDLYAKDQPLRQRLPRQCIRFDDAVQLALSSETNNLAHHAWREGAFDLRGFRHDISFYGKRLSVDQPLKCSVESLWQRMQGLIRFGETVRYWRVYRIDEEKRVILLLNWPLPGKGGFEISLESQANAKSAKLHVTHHWHPAGVWGLLFWFSFWPFRYIALKLICYGLTRSSNSV